MASRTKKRQAAASVVESFFAAGGKKSTAQPRPAVHVPPRGIGPVRDPNPNDVLCGRGGRINAHEGNVQFRDIVAANKKEYLAKSTKKLEKAHIAARIVETIRCMDPPGRFLKEDSDTGMWFDIGDAKAIKKAGQALREDAPDIRTGNESGDEDEDSPPKKTPTNAAPKIKSPPTAPMVSQSASAPAPARGTPTGGRVPLQHHQQQSSFNSTGSSSTFGMPLPAAQTQMMHSAPTTVPASYAIQDMSSFPATASVSSTPFAGVAASTGMYANQMFRHGTSRTSGAMSERAVEMMEQNQLRVPPSNKNGRERQSDNPDDYLFGRGFTPTELSAGSISTISGMSALSSNMTGGGSRFGIQSLGSSGHGRLNPIQEPSQTMRMSQLNYPHLRNLPSSHGGNHDFRLSMGQVSDVTNNSMVAPGVTRTSSFGEVSASNMSLSDGSMLALLSEDKNVESIVATMPPPMFSGTSRGGRFLHRGMESSSMSVTSMESGKTNFTYGMQSLELDREWRNTNHGRGGGQHNGDFGQPAIPWDSQTMMSDVSDKLGAVDLAGPNYH